jgi:hypothetical protein
MTTTFRVCQVPRSLCYDIRNNSIWGYDPARSKFTFWRNLGLAPMPHAEKPEVRPMSGPVTVAIW